MWQGCLDRDRKAQEELYARFSPLLRGICLRYASSEMEADDLLQESFIRAFKNINQYQNKGNLGAWLRKIAVNVALEMYRKNRSFRLLLNEFSMEQHHENQLDDALQHMALEDLLHKIQQLPVGFRTVFNLYAIEGYNHLEIAKLLSISEGTSKSQYSRARWLLRQLIEKESTQETKRMNYAKG